MTTSSDLMDEGILAELDIQCLVLKYPPEVSKEVVSMDYPREMEFLAGNEKRTQFIKNLTLGQKGNTLILFQYVDKHGRKIYDAFQKLVSNHSLSMVEQIQSTEKRLES